MTGQEITIRKANIKGTGIITIPRAIMKFYGLNLNDVLIMKPMTTDTFLITKTGKKAEPRPRTQRGLHGDKSKNHLDRQ